MREILKRCTREENPQHWAETQNNLSLALQAEARHLEGPEAERLLREAVDGYRAALRMLELAALVVGTSDAAAPFLLDDLNTELAKLPADFQIRWDWRGTRYFIEHSDAAELAPHREWILALIDAAAAPNRDAILEKLRALPQPPEKSP